MTEPTTPTEASAEMWFYVSGLLMAFMEPADPRMERIRASVLERIAAIETEAAQQERERLAPLIEAVRAYMDAPSKGPTAIPEQAARRIALSTALVTMWDRHD